MNHDSWLTVEPRSARITGSALVITRLSRVAMNIGSEAATHGQPDRDAATAARGGAVRGAACPVIGPDVEGGGHP